MKKILPVLIIALISIWSFSVKAEPLSAAEIQQSAQVILDNILSGFNEGNYKKYSQDFDSPLRDAIPENKFNEVRQGIQNQLGVYQNKSYLGTLTQNQQTITLWKGTFSKTTNDVLIKLVLAKQDNKIFATGLWFQ